MGESPELFVDLVEERAELLQALPHRRRRVTGDLVDREIQGGQELSRLVMERVGDASGLGVEPLGQVPQRGIRLVDASIGHLEGREALDEEALEQSENPACLFRRARVGEGRHRATVERRHIEDAQPFEARAAAQLVRALEGVLARAGQVFPERLRVLGFQVARPIDHGPLPT